MAEIHNFAKLDFKRIIIGCVSGSPNLQLYSSTFVMPLSSIISPAYKKPVYGMPSDFIASTVGLIIFSIASSKTKGLTIGAGVGAYALSDKEEGDPKTSALVAMLAVGLGPKGYRALSGKSLNAVAMRIKAQVAKGLEVDSSMFKVNSGFLSLPEAIRLGTNTGIAAGVIMGFVTFLLVQYGPQDLIDKMMRDLYTGQKFTAEEQSMVYEGFRSPLLIMMANCFTMAIFGFVTSLLFGFMLRKEKTIFKNKIKE